MPAVSMSGRHTANHGRVSSMVSRVVPGPCDQGPFFPEQAGCSRLDFTHVGLAHNHQGDPLPIGAALLVSADQVVQGAEGPFLQFLHQAVESMISSSSSGKSMAASSWARRERRPSCRELILRNRAPLSSGWLKSGPDRTWPG